MTHSNVIILPMNALKRTAAEAALIAEARAALQLLPHDRNMVQLLVGDKAIEASDVLTHLTASSIVFEPSIKRVLLLHREGTFIQPGGHVEPSDHSLLAAAARELNEETGLINVRFNEAPIDVDLHEVNEPERVKHLDFRFLGVTEKLGEISGDESDRARWLQVNEIPRDSQAGRLIAIARDMGVDACEVSGKSLLLSAPVNKCNAKCAFTYPEEGSNDSCHP